MKKGVLLLAGLLVVYILLGFVLAGNLQISRNIEIHASGIAVARAISEPTHTRAWWPGKTDTAFEKNQVSFYYNNYLFGFKKIAENNIAVAQVEKKDTLAGYIRITAASETAVTINWSCSPSFPKNLFTNIYYYYKARQISNAVDDLLAQIKQYAESNIRLYGFEINLENLTEDIITVCRQTCAVENKYQQLQLNFEKLNAYILKNKLQIKGNYMSNIKRLSNDSVSLITGIPTTTYAGPEGNISYMQMPLGGHMVTVLYKGPFYKRDTAFAAMAQHISDYEMSNIAVPYEKYMDNRIPTSDTSVTDLKLYYPVF